MREKKIMCQWKQREAEGGLPPALKLEAGISAKEGRCLSVLENAREQTLPVSPQTVCDLALIFSLDL